MTPGSVTMPGNDDELRHFLGVDRRKDHATAAIVDVGLVFMRVFGREKGWAFFSSTLIEPEVCWRVIRDRTRGSPPDVNPEQTGDVHRSPR